MAVYGGASLRLLVLGLVVSLVPMFSSVPSAAAFGGFYLPFDESHPPSQYWSTGHPGIDYGSMPIGTPILASADGWVSIAVGNKNYTTRNCSTDYGNVVRIDHANGYATLYAHLKFDSLGVGVGSQVVRGQPIALSGDTGCSSAPHLHFELRKGNVGVNPYLGISTSSTYLWATSPASFPPSTPCNPNGDQVAVYLHTGQFGRCSTLVYGTYGSSVALRLPNDSISSVKVGANVKATLCQHNSLLGTCTSFTGDDNGLGDNPVGNDQVSSIRVERRAAVDPDDNRTLASAQMLSGTINPATDQDTYYFNAVAGQVATLRMNRAVASLDPYLTLYKPDNTLLTYDDDHGPDGRSSLISNLSLPVSGRYRLVAASYQGTTAGGYAISLNLAGEACPGQYFAEYYNNRFLSGSPTFVRCDPWPVRYNWGLGGPGNGVGNDNFSVRWTRRVSFTAGIHYFRARADDGVRMWIGGQMLIDQWRDQAPTNHDANWNMAAGSYDVKVEYYENGGGAEIFFGWDGAIAGARGAEASGSPNTSRLGVDLTAPRAGETVSATTVVAAKVVGVDGARIERVVFQARPAEGGEWVALGADGQAPYNRRLNVERLGSGEYVLRAIASDAEGNAGASDPVTVTIRLPNPPADEAPARAGPQAPTRPVATPATVTLVAPESGAVVKNKLVLVAKVTQKGGSPVAQVVFEARPAGGEWGVIGRVRNAPYRRDVNLARLDAGRYAVRAVVTDRAGNSAASPAVIVTIGDDAGDRNRRTQDEDDAAAKRRAEGERRR